MKQILFSLFLLILYTNSFSQADTLYAGSPLDFYPLNTGDERQYKYTFWHFNEGATYSYYTKKVLKDTIISGHLYKKISGRGNQIRFERIDSTDYIVYEAGFRYNGNFEEYPIRKLNTKQDEVYGSYTCNIYYKSILGYTAEVKAFSYSSGGNIYENRKYEIAANLGHVWSNYDSGDMYTIDELIYAFIDGIEYGERFEDPPPPPPPPDDDPDNQVNNTDLDLELLQNSPNPFNLFTFIRFNISRSAEVKLSIYDTSGQLIRHLVDKPLPAGSYIIPFHPNHHSSGIYYYIIFAGGSSKSKKLIFLK